MIIAPAGELELLVESPLDSEPSGVTIICHPHPLYGGTLDNKVVYSVARELLELGQIAVRFNFRGVGRSSGTFADGRGEADDLCEVIRWVEKNLPGTFISLAGFSFGSAVAAAVAMGQPPPNLLIIAPPVTMEFFPQPLILPPSTNLGVIHGDEDQLIAVTTVKRWVAEVAPQAKHYFIPGADHFFHGQLRPLRNAVREIFS